ncbi:MAG: flagellar motor switch protein FliG [Acidimicrobiia bacterium]|nr:flagellar motor switch protein FliG [Acidimicrobiia bacterium]
MTVEPSLPGARKVAILILRLGVEKAGPLLFGLKKHEVAAVAHELASLGSVELATGDAVLQDFMTDAMGDPPLPVGDAELARHFLEESLGGRTAREILSQLDSTAPTVPFQFLDRLDPELVAANLAGEHPQTIALILSTLNVEYSGAVLEDLPEELVADVGVRLGAIDKVPSAALREVEHGLEVRLQPALEDRYISAGDGVDTLVKLMATLPKETGEGILTALEAQDSTLAEEVRSQMFVFSDMLLIEDRQMQLVLRQVDASVLPLALKGTSAEVRDKFLNNLSSRARDDLADEMELLGSVRMADVAEAQAGILTVVKELEDSGELVINRGGDDFVS